MLLDNLKDIFLKALQYTPALEQKAMIDLWNKECDSIWKDKEALIKETRAVCCAGISPEEIAHAKDLLSAEKDGRLVTLPCKVGDKVYEVAKGLSIYKSGLHPYVHEHIATELNVFDWERQKDFGKTVFLTRAEAEKALGKEQGHDE